ncbi:uncharacterized protein TNCV_197481 [Trichonephila clavipes]|nr:uncharacterized protein TNCV_197481 [Trichonephila clavipes]
MEAQLKNSVKLSDCDVKETQLRNLVKLRDCEVMEAQLRNEESAPMIRGIKNGASDEASDHEGVSMQLVPGTCCPLREPFRLNNAFYCFRKLMAELPHGYEKFNLSYLDNVVVFSEGWYFPIDHMDRILERNKRLAVRPVECELAQDSVEYRGHVVGLGKWSPAQLKDDCGFSHPIRHNALSLMQLFSGAIFQQDNARHHQARVSQDCFHTVTTIPQICLQSNISRIIWDSEFE